jgi:transposase
MAYSIDARELELKYRDNGHTLNDTFQEFGIAISTIRKWEKIRAKNGNVAKKELNRSPRIYHGDALEAYIDENPDAFLKEIAKHFGGSISGAYDALKREKITYKKKTVNTKNATRKNGANMTEN